MWRWAEMSGTGSGEERKVSSLRELSPAIEPARDLWPQIEARINAERSTAPAAQSRPRAVPPRWLAAAAVVASVAVGVWIGRSLLPAARPGSGAESTISPSRATAAGAPTAPDVAYVPDPRYERDRAALMRSLQARLVALPPPARVKVMASLAAIHRAKEDPEDALGKDPRNDMLQEMLVNTYHVAMRA